MKKKLLALLLSLVAALSLAGMAFTVSAADDTAAAEAQELSVVDVNFNGGWNGFLINFNVQSGKTTENIDKPANIVIQDSAKQDITDSYGFLLHESYLMCLNSTSFMGVGTVITLKAGFVFADQELKEDVSFIYAEANKPLVAYDPATHDPTSLAIDNDEADNKVFVNGTLQLTATVNSTATTVLYYSDDEEVATVNKTTGVVSGIAEGSATITAKAGTLTDTFEVTVLPALEVKGVEFGTSYKIYVEQNGTLAIPSDFTAHPYYDNEGTKVTGNNFALTADNCKLGTVDTSTLGTKSTTATVTFEEEEYTLDVSVEVYEVYEMDIKELGVVEWFNFAIFVQFPNSTVNVANLTDSSLIPNATKYTYTRADGTEVSCGTYNLGGGNIAILPSFLDGNQNIDNWNKAPYMQEGDRITLQAGLEGYMWTGELTSTATDNAVMVPGTGMVVPECRLTTEVTYVFDGSIWMLYIPYTDLEVDSEASVMIGETVSLNAVRVPSDATEGNFYYESSDTSIVTVNSNGRITGVKEGTATITVTLKDGEAGEKTKTVTVTVTDGIIGLEFAEGSSLTVAKGTETLDLSGLTANLVWASGKTQSVDLSTAEIIGYDKDTVGETEVTVRVTVDGQTYQAQLPVTVTENGGCSSSIGAASVCAVAIALLGAASIAIVVFRRKKAD